MSPETCIFIKSWRQDLPWLKYCLQSIEKFFQSDHRVVLVLDIDCKDEVDTWNLTREYVHYCKVPTNGYIDQQIQKLNADLKTGSEYILFVDSDTIFHTPCTLQDFLVPNPKHPTCPLIRMYYQHYSNVGDAKCWKEPTEKALGFVVEYEYMRRLPIVHNRHTLHLLHYKYLTLRVDLEKMTTRNFSEFNVLGAFAHKFLPHLYYWHNVDTEPPLPPVAKQFWSWGNLTPAIEKEIQELLK